MNKKPLVALLVLIVAGAAGTAWWRSKDNQPGNAAQGPAASGAGAAQTVTVVPVQRGDVPVTLEAAGTIVSLNTVDVRAQVSSTVGRVAIREGQTVRQGDLLFTLDDRADRANLDKARAQLLRDRATLADLNRQWQRAQDLLAQNFISQGSADATRTQLEAQQAAIKADEAAVQAAEVTLGYSAVRSPLNGRAGAINVYPGSQVQPGGNALVTISQVDPIGVSFSLPETQLAALLRPGAVALPGARAATPPAAAGSASTATGPLRLAVSLPSSDRGSRAAGGGSGANAPDAAASTASGAAGGGSPASDEVQGQLTFIDNAVDTTTGTIRLKGTLPNARQQLWPGQYVTVRITLRDIKDALVLPQAALIPRGSERVVYVVGADGKAQSRSVKLRYAFGPLAVVDGLEGNEQVVVEGKQNLRPGAPVRIAAPKPQAAASGASR